MNILFVLNDFHGGATQGILEFIGSLDGHAVKAFAVGPKPPKDNRKQLLDSLFQAWTVLPMPWWNISGNLPTYKRIAWDFIHWWKGTRKQTLSQLKDLCREWDIDLIYSGTIMTIEGALTAKATQLPHIWHMKATFGSTGRLKFHLKDPELFDFILSHSDRVFVMTDFIRSHFLEQASNPKIIKVKDGVNLDQFTYDKSAAKKSLVLKYGLPEDTVLIGMAANFGALWKNHILFIEVAKKLLQTAGKKNYQFIAFGIVPAQPQKGQPPTRTWKYFEHLQEKVEEYGLAQHFTWAGFHNNIPEMMAGLDILFHPCPWEPFGRISIEAMAAGTPVVGPNTGGIAEAVENDLTGILRDQNDLEGFASAIIKLSENQKDYQKMSQNARSYVAKNFHQLDQSKHILNILDEVVTSKNLNLNG